MIKRVGLGMAAAATTFAQALLHVTEEGAGARSASALHLPGRLWETPS